MTENMKILQSFFLGTSLEVNVKKTKGFHMVSEQEKAICRQCVEELDY